MLKFCIVISHNTSNMHTCTQPEELGKETFASMYVHVDVNIPKFIHWMAYILMNI